MTNPYYNTTGTPATGSHGASANIRAELALIQAGFELLPTLSGNGDKLIGVNAGATALEAKSITFAGAFTTVGAYAVTLTFTGVTGVTFPTSGTLATRAGTETLTNKTINGPDNTLTNIANASLSNSAMTFGATSVSLGGTLAAINAMPVGNSTPSTGVFTTTTQRASMNAATLSVDTTIPASYNASMVGPVTVGSGVTLTVESGATLVFL